MRSQLHDNGRSRVGLPRSPLPGIVDQVVELGRAGLAEVAGEQVAGGANRACGLVLEERFVHPAVQRCTVQRGGEAAARRGGQVDVDAHVGDTVGNTSSAARCGRHPLGRTVPGRRTIRGTLKVTSCMKGGSVQGG